MKLPGILAPNNPGAKKLHRKTGAGFTLIEILIVIAIFTALATMGVIVGLDSYGRYLFRSDLATAASLLQKARSEAMNNIGETPHGVYFNDPANFILFYGASYATRNTSFDLAVSRNKTVATSGLTEIVFIPLSGTTAGGAVMLHNGVSNTTITVNNEGGINW